MCSLCFDVLDLLHQATLVLLVSKLVDDCLRLFDLEPAPLEQFTRQRILVHMRQIIAVITLL